MIRGEEGLAKQKRTLDELKSEIEKGIRVLDLGVFETIGLDLVKKDHRFGFRTKRGVHEWFCEDFWVRGWWSPTEVVIENWVFTVFFGLSLNF